MTQSNLVVLDGGEVGALLRGREDEVLAAVRAAYLAHAEGRSSLPHSLFLRFPEDPHNRIIALPAYLGGEFDVAGVKWVASFPGNLDAGLDRASAVLILNSARTGQPVAFLEASAISAQRTAASAALAALHLHAGLDAERVGVVGCGPIGFEVVRFLVQVRPEVHVLDLYDLDPQRALRFGQRCREVFPGMMVEVAREAAEVLRRTALVAFATTATVPHVRDPSLLSPESTVLHISLRDLTPEVIMGSDNVVDDVDHVCRAQTSVHLAEQLTGSRSFVRTTLSDVIRGAAPPRREGSPVVFSPFGLGVLDLAVGRLVLTAADTTGRGLRIPAFLPPSWSTDSPPEPVALGALRLR